jgi:predicted nucleotidyltransferase
MFMGQLASLLHNKREAVLSIASRHGAHNVRVFGSVARGDDGPGSDLDLLVDMDPDCSLFDRVELLEELRGLLGFDVDVVTEASLYWLLRRKILSEAKPL